MRIEHTNEFAIALMIVVLLEISPELAASERLNDRPQSFFALNAITPYHLAADESPELWPNTLLNLAKAKALGATHMRIDMWWHLIEPEPGNFQWEVSDRVIDEILKAELVPYPILCYNSNWSIDRSPDSPEEREAFGRYVRALVARYGDRVPVFEVWNEPNISMFWKPEPNPGDYVALMRETYEQAKAAKPDVTLIGFALAGADLDFLRACYRLGAAKYTDGIAFHHYYITEDESLLERQIFEIRQLMRLFGDGDETLIISESGLSTGPSPAIPVSTREGQARGLVRKHLTALAEGVDQFYYFKLMDDRAESDPDGYWGLIDWQRREKPSAVAYRTMTGWLGDSRYLGRLWGYELDPDDIGRSEVLAFEKSDGTTVLAAWARFEAPESSVDIALPVDRKLVAYDYMGTAGGAPNVISAVDGRACVTLTGDPVYLTGVSPRVREGLEIRFAPHPLALGRGERQRVEARFQNLGDDARVVSLSGIEESLLAAGIVAIAEESELYAEPGAATATSLLVSLREEAAPFPRRAFPLTGTLGARGALEIVQTPAVDLELIVQGIERERLTLKARATNLRPYPLDGEIIFNTTGAVTRISNLRPSETAEEMLQVTFGPGESSVVAEVKTHRGGTARSSYKTFTTAAAPTDYLIDGSLEDWTGAPVLHLSPITEMQLVPDPRTEIVDSNDISGTLRVAFTDSHILFALEAVDDVPFVSPFATTEIWRGDSLQIYIGFDGPTTHLNYRPNDFQIGFSTGMPSKGESPVAWNWRSLTSETDGGGPIQGAEVAVVETEDGYILEASVPLTEFGDVAIAPGWPMAFDVELNDLDRTDAATFDSALMWNGDTDNWRDPSLWGLLVAGPLGD